MLRRALVIALAVAAICITVALAAAPSGGGVPASQDPIRTFAPDEPISLVGLSERVGWDRYVFTQAVAAELARREEAARAAAARATARPALGNRRAGGVNWDGIARCETSWDPRNPNKGTAWWGMQGPRFSGGLGFYNGTWDSFGGREFAPNAGQATREQQIIVAERVYARHGLSGWGCRAYG